MEKSSAMIADNKRSQETNTEVSKEETNSKIIKLSEVATNNLDPLIHFSRFLGISEMILNHLSAKDLIKVSEVNPIWYNVIASSKVLMENIKVVFNGIRELKTTDFDLLKNSSRKYQSIEVRQVQDNAFPFITEFNCFANLELDFFISKARDWKNVSITDRNFKKKMDLYNFLSSIESSVESFSVISKFGFNATQAFLFEEESSSELKSFKVLKFPKLRHLKMEFFKFPVIGVNYAEFLVNSVTIERFDFKDWHGFIVMDSILPKMLENFDKITSLSLDASISSLFEDQTWKRFQFKLKNLVLIAHDSELHSTNLREFINSQKDYLEELTIHLDNDIEMFNNIMRLPKLKILHLVMVLTLSKDEVPNVLSTSITHLECKHLMNPGLLLFLIKSMPNVKSIQLSKMSKKHLQALLDESKKYEEFKAARFVFGEEDLKIFLP